MIAFDSMKFRINFTSSVLAVGRSESSAIVPNYDRSLKDLTQRSSRYIRLLVRVILPPRSSRSAPHRTLHGDCYSSLCIPLFRRRSRSCHNNHRLSSQCHANNTLTRVIVVGLSRITIAAEIVRTQSNQRSLRGKVN